MQCLAIYHAVKNTLKSDLLLLVLLLILLLLLLLLLQPENYVIESRISIVPSLLL